MNVTISPNGNTTSIIIDNTVRLITSVAVPVEFQQLIPARVWYIHHKMGKHPSITIVDNDGNVVEGDYRFIDSNNITATFTALFSGVAYLN